MKCWTSLAPQKPSLQTKKTSSLTTTWLARYYTRKRKSLRLSTNSTLSKNRSYEALTRQELIPGARKWQRRGSCWAIIWDRRWSHVIRLKQNSWKRRSTLWATLGFTMSLRVHRTCSSPCKSLLSQGTRQRNSKRIRTTQRCQPRVRCTQPGSTWNHRWICQLMLLKVRRSLVRSFQAGNTTTRFKEIDRALTSAKVVMSMVGAISWVRTKVAASVQETTAAKWRWKLQVTMLQLIDSTPHSRS